MSVIYLIAAGNVIVLMGRRIIGAVVGEVVLFVGIEGIFVFVSGMVVLGLMVLVYIVGLYV